MQDRSPGIIGKEEGRMSSLQMFLAFVPDCIAPSCWFADSATIISSIELD